jgi:hypothetical protein
VRLVWATATPPHMTPANSTAKIPMPDLLQRFPTLPRTRIARPFPCDRHSLDETIDVPNGE